MRSFFLFYFFLLVPVLLAQKTNPSTTPDANNKKEKTQPKRTLRVMLVGSRALPAFETRGAKIVEVDPPLSAMPPTSFEFANPRHAPKIKKKGKDATRKISYSAWANELVTIKNYKGPELLPLHLKRALISTTDFQKVDCRLGKSINPFIVISASKGNQGWKNPQAKVIDWDPVKHPAKSMLVLNQTKLAIKMFLGKKVTVIAPGRHKHFRVRLSKENTFRYKLEASDGKSKITVANTQYRLNKNSRLIMVALPGIPPRSGKLPRPTLRTIADTL